MLSGEIISALIIIVDLNCLFNTIVGVLKVMEVMLSMEPWAVAKKSFTLVSR